MNPVDNAQTSFFPNSIYSGFTNKPWKVVALAVGGVAIFTFGFHAASIISLSKAFAITLGTASVGYIFFKNRIEQHKEITNEERIELLNNIVTDLTPLTSNINEKLVLFGYRLKDDKNESTLERYESTTHQNSEEVIKDIRDFLSKIKNYTKNSILEIELAIFSKIDTTRNTLEYKSLYKRYRGLSQESCLPVEKTLHKTPFDKTFQTTAKTFRVIQIDRSRWNGDGTFA